LDEAVEMFKKALQLTPNNINFNRNLALAYDQQGKKAAAEAVRAHIKWLTGHK
jgi:Flp pilus assembly protein TadD